LAKSNLGLTSDVLAKLRGKDAAANVSLPSSLSDPAQRLAVLRAFAWSMRNMWIMYTAFGGLAVLSSMWVKHGILRNEHTETVTGIKNKERANTDVAS
jgi:hypothetical protein